MIYILAQMIIAVLEIYECAEMMFLNLIIAVVVDMRETERLMAEARDDPADWGWIMDGHRCLNTKP